MFTFLRKIRKSTLNTAISRKYLMYAAGEIFLVVIGILIALSINNWNESRKEQQYEIEVLTEIYEGLRADSARLAAWWLPRIENKWEGVNLMSKYVYEEENIEEDELWNAYFKMSQGLLISVNMGPFESLKSKGLELISDKKLRFWLVDVFESVLPRQISALSKSEEEHLKFGKSVYTHFWSDGVVLQDDGSFGFTRKLRSSDPYKDELLIQIIMAERDNVDQIGGRVNTIRETINLTLNRLRKFLEENGIDINQSTLGSIIGVRGILSDSLEVKSFGR